MLEQDDSSTNDSTPSTSESSPSLENAHFPRGDASPAANDRQCEELSHLSTPQVTEHLRSLFAGLPRQPAEQQVPGIQSKVKIDIDSSAVPRIKAQSLREAVLAQGYMHAKDRFFQMDLQRRATAGRLSELLGSSCLEQDKAARVLGFEGVAGKVLANMTEHQRGLLEAYTQGVNSWLKTAPVAAPEYKLASLELKPWSAEDSILVSLSLFTALSDSHVYERSYGVMKDVLAPEVFEFLLPKGGRFDAPLDGSKLPAQQLQIPGAEHFEAAAGSRDSVDYGFVKTDLPELGSNAFAVAASRGEDGRAILASDPHLPLGLPTIFYQNELDFGSGAACGASIAGCPGLVIGSNKLLAWGLTNLCADTMDLITLEQGENARSYLTSQGDELYKVRKEKIHASDLEKPVTLDVVETKFGPVVGQDHKGQKLALRWTALDADKVNLNVLELLEAASVQQGLDIAKTWYGPPQNVLFADRKGEIGSVSSGFIVEREPGEDGRVPIPSSQAEDLKEIDDSRRVIQKNPEQGFLSSGNQAPTDSERTAALGHGFSLGTRAKRISELIESAGSDINEFDLEKVQLDTRVELYDWYKELVFEAASGTPSESTLGMSALSAAQWDGHSNEDSRALPLLVELRQVLHREVLGPILAPCKEADPEFVYFHRHSEEALRLILEERPDHLLPNQYHSWSDLLRSSVRKAVKGLSERGLNVHSSWGDQNRIQLKHPLSEALPHLSQFLDSEEVSLAGNAHAVRVLEPGFGSAMRMVVSPEFEERASFQNAGGQHANPLSEHYQDALLPWMKGVPGPLLAQQGHERIVLKPEESGSEVPAESIDVDHDHGAWFLQSKYLTAVRALLTGSSVFRPLCRHIELSKSRRGTPDLPQELKDRFDIPRYKLLHLSKSQEQPEAFYYEGKIEIEGKELHFDFFLPKNAAGPVPFLVTLPITEGGHELNKLVSLELAREGYASGSIQRRGGIFCQDETIDELEEDLRSTIRHQRAFLSFMTERDDIDPNRLGSVGLSLGGMIGVGLAAVDPRVKGSILALAGADFPSMLHRSNFDLIQAWREKYKESTRDCTDCFERLVAKKLISDPRNLAQYVEPEEVLFVSAMKDMIVPKSNSKLLLELLGKPEHLRVPFGHYGAFLSLNWILKHSKHFLARRFGDKPRHN